MYSYLMAEHLDNERISQEVRVWRGCDLIRYRAGKVMLLIMQFLHGGLNKSPLES